MNAFTFRRLKEKGAPRRRWGSRGQSWEDEEEESQMGRQRGFFRGGKDLVEPLGAQCGSAQSLCQGEQDLGTWQGTQGIHRGSRVMLGETQIDKANSLEIRYEPWAVRMGKGTRSHSQVPP